MMRRFTTLPISLRILTSAFLLSLFTVASFVYFFPRLGRSSPKFGLGTHRPDHDGVNGNHSIDHLVRAAEKEWQRLLSKESQDLTTAARQYRFRRGRHPPPGFAQWYEYAKERNALVVEDFFDQIYHDLNPFWGLSPSTLREQAQGFEFRIVVRNHNTSVVTDIQRDWMDSWSSLVQSIEQFLPDLDMPINVMDESRIIVPWDDLSRYVEAERSSRRLVPAEETVATYSSVVNESQSSPPYEPVFKTFEDGPFWDRVRVGCPENSPSRQINMPEIDFSSPPPEYTNFLRTSYHGYVSNWTQSKDICSRPELQALHGSFIEPVSISTTHELFPLFGGSKLPVNNEILIPPAMYWVDNERYSGGADNHGGAWAAKRDQLVWRGAATGGRNRPENWRGFQRHRFLSMMNGTQLRHLQAHEPYSGNFLLPRWSDYDLRSGRDGRLADFVDDHADVGFVHLVCFPYDAADPHCPYTEPHFAVTDAMPMKDQYGYKYLPDIDGNSFSGRYRGFLLSTSLPVKATVYNEWHDSRLVPWAHFVPMDSTFLDIYGIMEYFFGYGGSPGHDFVARKIALDGKKWAETVLRKEDMQVYVYRLLLEYARLCDDKRDVLGSSDESAWD